VINYDTGQISAFGFGGLQGGAVLGGLSGSVTRGYVWGLNGDNSNYAGGFTTASISGGASFSVGLWWSGSSNGINGLPNNILPNGPVRASGESLGVSLFGPVSVAVSVTDYSKPKSLGKFWAFGPKDFWIYAGRQIFCQ
jgi:hypothetical protein